MNPKFYPRIPAIRMICLTKLSELKVTPSFCFLFKIPDNLTATKGCLSLFHYSIDMKKAVNLSISCRNSAFLLENYNKNTFFLNEMDKLTAVFMSIE